jgi:hypothetical protein
MRSPASIALIALATSGCIGSTGSSAPSNQAESAHQTLAPGPRPDTSVAITYTMNACPPGVRCLTVAGQDYVTVTRHLDCAPTQGDYPNPAAACRALGNIVTKLAHPGATAVCDCLVAKDGPKIMGSIDGQRQLIRLDPCSICLVDRVRPDLAILLPGSLAYG